MATAYEKPRPPMAASLADQHAKALENYLNAARPIFDLLGQLHSAMPATFIVEGGNFINAGRQYWPDWAKDYAENLEQMLGYIKQKSFKDFEE